MTTVSVLGMGATVSEKLGELSFSIPTRHRWTALPALVAWLVMWCPLELFIVVQITVGAFPDNALFVWVAWLVLWSVVGALLLHWCLWRLAGKELVIATQSTLTHRFEMFGMGRERVYDLSHARDLRVSPQSWTILNPISVLTTLGFAGGAIAFDYGARTVRMGVSVDEPEGRMIVDRLRNRFAMAGPSQP